MGTPWEPHTGHMIKLTIWVSLFTQVWWACRVVLSSSVILTFKSLIDVYMDYLINVYCEVICERFVL